METAETFKQRYDDLAKKYKLPSWDELNAEFEILYFSPLIEIRHPIALVTRRVRARFNDMLSLLHGVVNPTPSDMIYMKEHSFLNEDDKKDALQMLTRLMIVLSKSDLLFLGSDKEQAEYLKEHLKLWKVVKKDYKKLSRKIEHGWEKTIKDFK